MLPTTIDGVIDSLTRIIDAAVAQNSRLGYFAALYRTVTIRVKEGIAAGRFEDGSRVERLDVVFANRYLEAFEEFRKGRPVTGSWRVAFEAAAAWSPIVLQHLLLGMNAHINLDLGIAAAEVAPGAQLPGLKNDFNRINDVLFELIHTMEERVAGVSPWIGLLATLGGRTDDQIVRFNLTAARALSWRTAGLMAGLPAGARPGSIARLDTVVETLGRAILRPGPLLRAGLWVIRSRESSEVARVVEVLSSPATPLRYAGAVP